MQVGYENRDFQQISRLISELIEDMAQFLWNANRNSYAIISSDLDDLEWLSEIFNGTKHARPICDSWANSC